MAMIEWLAPLAEISVGLLLLAVALWMRASIVSLNKDMRAVLDGHAEIRARLDALEREKAL
jgi:hypothetical protein